MQQTLNDAALHKARARVMQTAQGASATQQPSQHTQLHFGAQESIGAPFPQPGGSAGSSATSNASGGGGGGGAQNVLGVLALTIGGLHDSTSEKFAQMDGVVRELAGSLTAVREGMHGDLLKLAEWHDRAHERQMRATMLVLERVRVLERTLGEVRSLGGEESVVGRMQRMDCALAELLEQVQDPQAGRTSSYLYLPVPAYAHGTCAFGAVVPQTRHFVDRGTSPVAPALVLVEAGVDAPRRDYVDVCVVASEPVPIRFEATVNTTERAMADASTMASPAVSHTGVMTEYVVVAEVGGNSSRQVSEQLDCLGTPETTKYTQAAPAQWSSGLPGKHKGGVLRDR